MKSNLIMLCLLGLASTLNAQDPRERHYYYEILDPRHEPKPLVEGFARERVTENLNRGLTVTPARDGKGIYLSWRLLASDAPGTAFHVYREADGKARRLTKKPLTQTCDSCRKGVLLGGSSGERKEICLIGETGSDSFRIEALYFYSIERECESREDRFSGFER